jgi:hypothetical protein
MTRHQKTILAMAVLGTIGVLNSATAAVNISDPAANSVVYASEIVKGANGVSLSAVAANALQFKIGYNFSDGEVRYARVECDTNLVFNVVTNVAVSGNSVTTGSINGTGTNAIFFSLTGTGAASQDTNATVNTSWVLKDNNPASCSYSLYDMPSQAQAGGTSGRILTVGREFLKSASGVKFTVTPNTATADVDAANGSYTLFTTGANGSLGTVKIEAASGVLIANGAAAGPTTIYGANTSLVLAGDISATAANGIVQIDAASNCSVPTGVNAFDTQNRTTGLATEVIGAAALERGICFVSNQTVAIPAATYALTLKPVATSNSYAVSDTTLDFGKIVRNGTELVAPLAQVPTGWLSRLVLNNTGTVARAYTVTLVPATGGSTTESSTTYSGTLTATGTIPANGTTVVSVADLFPTANFTGPARGTLKVTVSATRSSINGMYQIVNPTSGSISNHILVAPGTN